MKSASLIGLALLLAACGGSADEDAGGRRGGSGGPQGPVTVGYVVIQQGSAPLEQQLPGQVAAYQVSEVRPQVSGVIQRRLFREGTRKEKIAVDEARKLKIPVIGVVDTNCDPDEVDYVIPGNDDALRAIRLFASKIAEAVSRAAASAKPARRRQRWRRGPRAALADQSPGPRSEQATTPASV